MKLKGLFLLLILSSPAISHSPDSIVEKLSQKYGPSITERLRDHFDRNEIQPDLVINNNRDFGAVRTKLRTTKLANHRIVWISTATENDVELSLKIDNETISLIDRVSLNDVDDDQKWSFVNDWDQVKLYTIGNREIIGITFIPTRCTGLMCGISAQLLYDIKTKSRTFFGTFRTDSNVRLFRYSQDDTPYYIAKNFDGDPHGLTTPAVVSYELYKFQPNGQFLIQKDSAGKNYFIKHTTFPYLDFEGQEVVPKKVLKDDELEQNWIRKVE